jgi:hypothetical protein
VHLLLLLRAIRRHFVVSACHFPFSQIVVVL